MNEQVMLLPIDAADVTIVVDNSVDLLLPGNEMAHCLTRHLTRR